MKKTNWKNHLSMTMAAIVAASSMAMPATAAAAEERAEDLVYATVNMPYADFYYGELTDLAAGTQTQPELDTEDPVTAAGFREEGEYDAVTSATTSKSKRFPTTYFEEKENGVDILGIADVQVAVPRDLYDNALEAIAAGEACSNKLLEFVESMTVSDTAFEEYKILNADGTFSKMVTDTEESSATASITANSVWGNYQISLEGTSVTTDELLGAVMETTDGAKYGLKHLDNLWLQTKEIAFAVEPEFVEPHGNTVEYQRFEDIQGKTIKTITFLLKNKADLVIQTELKCKNLLDESKYGASAQETAYSAAGTRIPVELNVPADADYQVASVAGAAGTLAADSYSYSDGALTLAGSCHPGAYTVTLTDEKYEDISVTAVVKSTTASARIEHNQLFFQDSVSTMEEYLKEVTSIVVNGQEYEKEGIGTLVFPENGVLDFDAKYSTRGGETIVFPEGKAGNYTLVLKAPGFADVEASVGAAYEKVEKTNQVIAGASSFAKTFGDAAFSLGASAEGALTYASSNTNVVKVDGKGNVTITGAGSAVITVRAAETAAKLAASKSVSITVKKAVPVIAAASAEKVYGAKAFSLNASSNGGALTYQTSDKKVATVDAAGKVTLKGTGKATITLVSAETANYQRAEKKITLTVKPKKAALKGVNRTSSKKAVVKWKKDPQATGYEILVSTSKKFKKNVKKVTVNSKKATKKTVSGLKAGKKYFVKIRSFKKSQGTKIFGAYSAVKTMKAK